MEIARSDITRRRRENNELNEDKARRARHSRATGGRFGDSSAGGGKDDDDDGDGSEKGEEAARRANERFRALASQIRVTQVRSEWDGGFVCLFFFAFFFRVLGKKWCKSWLLVLPCCAMRLLFPRRCRSGTVAGWLYVFAFVCLCVCFLASICQGSL